MGWFVSALQGKKSGGSPDYSTQKLLLGTHTSEGEQNHLMIADVRVPNENAEVDGARYEDRDMRKLSTEI